MEWISQWITQNIVAILALLGTAITAFLGYRGRRVMSGDREADQEKEMRDELRQDVKALKDEVKALKAQNSEQAEEMLRLRELSDSRLEELEEARTNEALLTARVNQLEAIVVGLKEDVARQVREITELKRMNGNGGPKV